MNYGDLKFQSIHPRGSVDNFSSSELSANVPTCNYTLIDGRLLELLEKLRLLTKEPIKITSGYRCAHYQLQLKLEGYETASGQSTHELGMAADALCESISGGVLETLARQAGFTSVGVGHSWCHLDTRIETRRWVYAR